MPELRPLGEADRQQWLALRLALWPRKGSHGFDADITEILGSGGRLAAFGAFDGDRLIGFIEVGERPWGDGCETSPVGWVEGIYVDPAHRRSGLGRPSSPSPNNGPATAATANSAPMHSRRTRLRSRATPPGALRKPSGW
jgi:GNAT superfamily N-acetyltransferase